MLVMMALDIFSRLLPYEGLFIRNFIFFPSIIGYCQIARDASVMCSAASLSSGTPSRKPFMLLLKDHAIK